MWYYGLRLLRFDYPVWGDSIGIPVFSESFAWLIGAVVTSGILRLLLIRHTLPTTIQLVRPVSVYGWLRAAFIVAWLIVLGSCIVSGVPDGDEGLVIASMSAAVILLAFLFASELPSRNAPVDATVQPAANGA